VVIQILLGGVTVAIHDGWTLTRFADGAELHALHAVQPGQSKTAKALGYPSAAALNREHDLAHSMLARLLGLPHSPTLRDAAAGKPATDLHAAEEEAVLAIQRFARALGIDLVDAALRLSQARE
jgi:hypothetical protein